MAGVHERRWGKEPGHPLENFIDEDPVPIQASTQRYLCNLPNTEIHVSRTFSEGPDNFPEYDIEQKSTWHTTLDIYRHFVQFAGVHHNAKAIEVLGLIGQLEICNFLQREMPNTDRNLVKALVPRWWSTTHSFHFSKFELGYTPLDFVMASGIGVAEAGKMPLPVYAEPSLATEEERQAFLETYFPYHLGVVTFDNNVKLRSSRIKDYIMTALNTPQIGARSIVISFVIYLLGCVFWPDSKKTILPGVALYAVELERMNLYDWGSSFLARLYASLDRASIFKRKSRTKEYYGQKSVSACWQFLEFFVYEYFGVLGPELNAAAADAYPLTDKYSRDNVKHSSGLTRFNYSMALGQFEMRSFHSVTFRPYVSCSTFLTPRIQAQVVRSTERLLFMDIQLGGFWYLGERFALQCAGVCVIPTDPPTTMSRLPFSVVQHFRSYNYPDLFTPTTPMNYMAYWESVSIGYIMPAFWHEGNVDITGPEMFDGPELPCPPQLLHGNVYPTQAPQSTVEGSSRRRRPHIEWRQVIRCRSGREYVYDYPQPEEHVNAKDHYIMCLKRKIEELTENLDEQAAGNAGTYQSYPSSSSQRRRASYGSQEGNYPTQRLGDTPPSQESYHPTMTQDPNQAQQSQQHGSRNWVDDFLGL